MAQEVERRLGKAEATGSNPVGSFIFLPFFKGSHHIEIICVAFRVV